MYIRWSIVIYYDLVVRHEYDRYIGGDCFPEEVDTGQACKMDDDGLSLSESIDPCNFLWVGGIRLE